MDMGWPLLFIIGAIALMIGPLMMLQPSRRQQELTALRQMAVQRGIRIHLNKAIGKHQSVAVYSLPWPTAVKTGYFCLIKQQFAHDLHFSGYWHWHNDGRPPNQWLAPLGEILESLPSDIVGMEVAEDSLGVFWLEKNQQTPLTTIENILKQSQSRLLNVTAEVETDVTFEPGN